MAYRDNFRLNETIEQFIDMWDGTILGYEIKNMYENGTDYESICERADIDYMDFDEE